MDERQYLLEAINKDLALIKKIEDRLRCEDDPRRQLKLETDSEETWQKIRERKAHLSSLEQEELKKTVSYLRLPLVKLDPLPLPKPPILDEDSSLTSQSRPPEQPPVVNPPDEKPRANYSQLRELLAAGKWKEADLETARVILEVANRLQDKDAWLRVIDIQNFPCPDLCVIDQLWRTFSQNRFGFTVQRDIWLSLDGKRGEFDEDRFSCNFSKCVGWRIKNKWIENYDDFTFTLNAPKGHLPSLPLTNPRDPIKLRRLKDNFTGLLSRVETCCLRQV
ncbi:MULTISPECIES: GUN4 domain-containing protein [unclassified Moorena]|uniref:GUN4 domain-containing protein n=1 Tax=unclassified Moorena TaxID=2683338 RepID=UPI0013C203CB|nr:MULTISPECIES: GUN4 domain-containing protein [unclassified Moorena]NEP35921.1 GUN4 domain-containing protein [Moorena sp. SIO3B2]NET69188.1 GUN4 domain-containing protein [Moorena sp. SIO1G6]